MSLGRTAILATLPNNSLGDLQGVVEARLIRHEFRHEVCVLNLLNQKTLGLRSGDPIKVTMSGAAGGTEIFIGYFDHLKDSLGTQSTERHTQLFCVGPTWYMQQPRQHTWVGMTLTQIARKICADYGLTISCVNSSPKITVNQSGESDWKFLCKLARRYGYVLYPTQTVVNLIPRFYQDEQLAQNAPLYEYSPLSSGQATDIYEFKPRVGDAPAVSGKAARIKQSVSASGSIISSSNDGTPGRTSRKQSTAAIFHEYDPDSVAQSAADLSARVLGKQADHAWIYHAKADINGLAGVVPTSMGYFKGLDGDWDGYWTFIGIDHCYDRHFHDNMKVELGTNSLGAPAAGYVANSIPVLNSVQRTPTATSTLAAPLTNSEVTLKTSRGTANNPLVWQGRPASLDPSAAEKRIPKSSLHRIRHGS